MAANTKYCEFFEIDTEYFPAVDEELINAGKVDWRKFYPHNSFIKLLNGAMDVLENVKNLSMWVEGAYGTGKSYAVFTLEKILMEPESEVEQYFNNNPSLRPDILNRILQVRKKKLLIVNRYGSSYINTDLDLINAIQTSITRALKRDGYQTQNDSTRESIIKWLSKPLNKNYFNSILQSENNSDRIGYNTVDEIISILGMTDESVTSPLVNNLVQLSQENNINIANVSTIDDLHSWIREVTATNGIDCLFFIWDEFTEFFSNRKNSLTGFQKIAEMSSDVTNHFKLLIVTHSSDSLLSKDDHKKILDRFVSPTYVIDLPENMALELIANALRIKNDPSTKETWSRYSTSLMTKVTDSAQVIEKQARIDEKTIQQIIPITPFAALMLMHLSAAFKSNQRSMFDFIKNTPSSEMQGFQWFIENNGPFSSWPLLTIDMLWNYFYENGKNGLDTDVRLVLDSYDINNSKIGSDEDLHRVYKAILLLQAMSNHAGNYVSIFKPTLDNLKNVFDGSPVALKVKQKADTLVNKQVLIPIQNEKGIIEYKVESNSADYMKIKAKIEEDFRNITTDSVLNDAQEIRDLFKMGNYYSRLVPILATKDTVKAKFGECKNKPSGYNKVDLIITLALKEDESTEATSIINTIDLSESPNILIVDGTKNYFGIDNLKSYVDNRAWEAHYTGKDTKRQKAYSQGKTNKINEWRGRLEAGKFFIYSQSPGVIECRSNSDLRSHLLTIVQKAYPLGIECFKISRDEYYVLSPKLKTGVLCSLNRSNTGWWKWKSDDIKKSLERVWDVDDYWLKPEYSGLIISKIKNAVEELIKAKIESEGSVSMEDIDNLLSQRPYGFIHNDISAYYLAFILTEYASSEYSIHNGGAAISDPKEALAEAIKSTYSLKDGRYSEWFISPISATIANFYEVASRVFAFNKVTNIDSCVDYIRASVRNLEFPLWTLQYAFQLEEPVQQFIDLSVQLVGSKNASKNSTLAEKIGKLPLSEDQIDDLKRTLTKEKCWEGMRAYLNKYRDGEFWTQSSKFRCPNALQFLADKQTKDSAWLWDEETTHKCIDECIDEFRIIAKVNLAYNTSTTVDTCRDALRKWFSSLILPVDMVVKKYPQHSDLLTSLYRFSKNGSDSHLISEIVNKLDDFDEVFRISTDSTTNFRGAFDEYLTDFDDEQLLKVIEKVNKTDPNSISLDQFNRMVTNAISETSKGMKKQELISLWKKETGTDSPKDWSTKHLTPIKALFEAKESESVELVINVLSGIATDKQYIEKALKYLKNSDMLSLLNDQEHIDKSFREKVLRQYSSIFQDLEKVRAELYKKQKNVDSWLHNTSLIEELAKKEYDSNAKARALDVINSIPLEQLQKYLRTQVETNMALGIEILRQYK